MGQITCHHHSNSSCLSCGTGYNLKPDRIMLGRMVHGIVPGYSAVAHRYLGLSRRSPSLHPHVSYSRPCEPSGCTQFGVSVGWWCRSIRANVPSSQLSTASRICSSSHRRLFMPRIPPTVETFPISLKPVLLITLSPINLSPIYST